MRRISSKLSYANVMSTIALFVALGGGAFAASRSVGTGGVVKLCVGHGGSVKLLTAGKSKCDKDTSLVAINQRGETGLTGPQGPQGPQGTAGTTSGAAAYSAGTGLTLSGFTFSADLTKLQARLAGSGCTAGQALQAVTQSGTPSCIGLHAYSAQASSPNYVDNDAVTVIPAGTWLLIGQEQATTAAGGDTITCHLQVNGQVVDTLVQTVTANGEYTEAPTAIATTTAATSPASIVCSGTVGSTIIGGNLTITAVPLAALN